MHKIREILRQGLESNRGQHSIAASCSVSSGTVNKYLNIANEKGLSYGDIKGMSDQELWNLLGIESKTKLQKKDTLPDWGHVHTELKKKGVTLQLLWEEYREETPDGYKTSQFNYHYGNWKKKLNLSMRQTHKAGEKMFVDYAGQTIPVTDKVAGKITDCQIFVAVLGSSNYSFAECTATQNLSDWIGSNIRAFEFFGGVTELIIPDNLKSGVTKACRYEPELNTTYHEFSLHYGTVIIPARVRKPKDKAKVEGGVLLVSRWILAALRNRVFFSLSEVNAAMSELLEKLNHKPFQNLNGSRVTLFEKIDKPALLPLPISRYVFAEWKKVRPDLDYHVELEMHYYSVPYQLVKEVMFLRYTVTTVEIFFKNKRIASHVRSHSTGDHTTLKEHMPKSHQKYLEWTPSRIVEWSHSVGESTSQVVDSILNSARHRETGYRSCLGIVRLGKSFSADRMEAACKRALSIGGLSYKSIQSILEKGLDSQPLSDEQVQPETMHENVRGSEYFH